jgi:hypothetical protein
VAGHIAHWLRDEEAAGSNPATPTTKRQVTPYPEAYGWCYASPGVRFWERDGCGRPSGRAVHQPIACRAGARPNLPPGGLAAVASPPIGLAARRSRCGSRCPAAQDGVEVRDHVADVPPGAVAAGPGADLVPERFIARCEGQRCR